MSLEYYKTVDGVNFWCLDPLSPFGVPLVVHKDGEGNSIESVTITEAEFSNAQKVRASEKHCDMLISIQIRKFDYLTWKAAYDAEPTPDPVAFQYAYGIHPDGIAEEVTKINSQLVSLITVDIPDVLSGATSQKFTDAISTDNGTSTDLVSISAPRKDLLGAKLPL